MTKLAAKVMVFLIYTPGVSIFVDPSQHERWRRRPGYKDRGGGQLPPIALSGGLTDLPECHDW
jgi:hypothetical protein